jgi:hypothetical protein
MQGYGIESGQKENRRKWAVVGGRQAQGRFIHVRL